MNNQSQLIDISDYSDFLSGAGWGGSSFTPMNADAGLRLYFKVTKEDKSVLLMDMSNVGYEGAFEAYIKIDRYLKKIGVRVPDIYKIDEDQQLSLIEVLGVDSFGQALRSGVEKLDIYEKATDVLIAIKQGAVKNDLGLIAYAQSRVFLNRPQFENYYVPAVTGLKITEALQTEVQEMWGQIEKNLPSCPKTLCHGDYHLENLMWRPESDEGYGLIDFQDAFWGPQPYDLLNLLEDARVSVPIEIKQAMKDRYCAGMSVMECTIFDDWYTVLSAHFHCRVLGLFVMLHQERGIDEYLVHIPRLQRYVSDNLRNPVLAPLKEFIERHNISLDKSPV